MTRTTVTQDDSGLLTFTEAATWLAVTESWLRRAVAAKRVPHRRIGRAVRFSPDDLDQIVAAAAVTVPKGTTELRPSRRT